LQLKVYGGRELSRWQLVCTEQRCHGREERQYAGDRRIAFVFLRTAHARRRRTRDFARRSPHVGDGCQRSRQDMTHADDPISFELFCSAIFSIADEMASTIFRTTYAGVLKDNRAMCSR
jgi:hypothetical protein